MMLWAVAGVADLDAVATAGAGLAVSEAAAGLMLAVAVGERGPACFAMRLLAARSCFIVDGFDGLAGDAGALLLLAGAVAGALEAA